MSDPRPGDGPVLDGRLVVASSGDLAAGVPPLLHDALTALDAALGARMTGWEEQAESGKKVRVYRRRLELLAENLEPGTLEIVIRWLSSTHRGSQSTRRGYCDDLLSVWAPLARELGHERFAVGQLTTEHLELWHLRMTQQGTSDRTISRYTASLSSLYSYAAGVMDPPPRNPVTEDIRPSIDQADASTATPILEKHEVAAVAAQATSPGDLALISLLYILAGRVTEICQANVTDLHTVGRRTFLRVKRKGGEVRDLEIPLFLAELIDLYLAGRTDGPLILNSHGQRLDRHGADWISTGLGHAAGVLNGRDLTPHVWRASRITHMLDALYEQAGDEGVMAGIAQVMIFANQKNPQTTLRYWIRRSHAAKNAELAQTGEQVLVAVLRDWLTHTTNSDAELFVTG